MCFMLFWVFRVFRGLGSLGSLGFRVGLFEGSIRVLYYKVPFWDLGLRVL